MQIVLPSDDVLFIFGFRMAGGDHDAIFGVYTDFMIFGDVHQHMYLTRHHFLLYASEKFASLLNRHSAAFFQAKVEL